jgi:hypothetical protein
MAIVTRLSKGSKLTIEEMDNNLLSLETDISANVSAITSKLDKGAYTGSAKDLENAIIAAVTGASGISITPTSPAPSGTGIASFTATQAGTYTNYGGVVVNANSFAIISRSATSVFSISQTALVLPDSKINLWTAKVYAIGDQVNYLGKDWTANAATVAGDVPGTSSKWSERLIGYRAELTVDVTNTTKAVTGNAVFDHIENKMKNFTTFLPKFSVGSQTGIGTTNQIYANKFIFNYPQTIDSITVKAGTANVVVTKINLTTNLRTIIATLNKTIDGVETFSLPLTTLELNEYIGINSAKIYYQGAGTVLGVWEDKTPNFVSTAGIEIAYSLSNSTLKFDIFGSSQLAKDYADTLVTMPIVPFLPINKISDQLSSTINNKLYANKFIFTYPQKINDITINAGVGNIVVTKINIVTNVRTTITNLFKKIEGVESFTIPVTTLQDNEYIGINSSAKIYYQAGGTVLGVWEDNVTNFRNTTTIEIAYSLGFYQKLKEVVQLYSDDTAKNKSDIAVLQYTVLTASTGKYASLFKDDFSTVKADWVATGSWNINTTSKEVTTTSLGAANPFRLNRIYNLDDRYLTTQLSFGSDTLMRIHCKRGTAGEGESLFGIDALNSKIIIYRSASDNPTTSSGVTTTILKETPVTIVANRNYILELWKDVTTSRIVLIDTVSGVKTILEHNGWEAGRQNVNYSFYLESGTTFKIKSTEVFGKNRPFIVAVGDSITEGVMVIDRTQRYASLIKADGVNLVISAMGGDNIDGVNAKFETEYKFILPKYIMVLIGANGGNTLAKWNTFISNCEAYGIIPIIHYNTCQYTSNVHIATNNIIATLNKTGCRFDFATAINNDPIGTGATNGSDSRYNAALYYDSGLHPKEAGNIEMYKRFKIDFPQIFN